MSHISKAAATYTYHPDCDYLCRQCCFIKEISAGKSGCCFFGPQVTIKADVGSCNYFTHFDDDKPFDIPWLSLFTRQQLGYDENKHGFSCKRCAEFIVGRNDCWEVDKETAGDTPGEINPNACCSLWHADKQRGKMTDQQLVQILAARPHRGAAITGAKS